MRMVILRTFMLSVTVFEIHTHTHTQHSYDIAAKANNFNALSSILWNAKEDPIQNETPENEKLQLMTKLANETRNVLQSLSSAQKEWENINTVETESILQLTSVELVKRREYVV